MYHENSVLKMGIRCRTSSVPRLGFNCWHKFHQGHVPMFIHIHVYFHSSLEMQGHKNVETTFAKDAVLLLHFNLMVTTKFICKEINKSNKLRSSYLLNLLGKCSEIQYLMMRDTRYRNKTVTCFNKTQKAK